MNPNVGVFFGGRTVEHEISVISAMQTMAAIDASKYKAVPIYIAKDGEWYTGDLLSKIDSYKNLDALLSKCNKCALVKEGSNALLIKIPPSRFKRNVLGSLDIAFPVMHGTGGEDGTLQGYFEMIDIPYVGSNVLGSSVGMDKVFTKAVLRQEGLPVLEHLWFYSTEIQSQPEKVIAAVEGKLKYPVIIKPANLGSSIGITTASNRGELEEAVDLAATFSSKIMIEPLVVAIREVNCSVLGDYTHCDTSLCEEPLKTDAILSFKDKYMTGNKSKGMSNLQRKIPADIPQEMTDKIRSLAKKTFEVLNCSGVARIDFIIDTNINAVYINEINTIPGSLSFYLWGPAGINFVSLTSKLIDLAFKRARENANLTRSFDANLLSLMSKTGSKTKL